MKARMIDLFAGCGGFSNGFQQAGFDVVGFVEWWPPAITTFLKNHPTAQHLGSDITKIPDETLQGLKGKVEIIAGGPPCQGFSMCGKRDPKDKRNQLYKEFLRFVRIIDPKIAIVENVQGLLSMIDYDGKKVIDKILHEFIRLGYSVCYKVLTASDYGVAQNRKRLIIIAKKLDIYPEISGRKKTVMDAICDLPEYETSLNAHVLFDTKQETLAKIRLLNQGEAMCKTYNCSRQRIKADRPSKTICTRVMYIHPHHHRFLTPRELARLQSFPDNFEFCGSKTNMVKQIGNAVPPLLARAIGKKIKAVL